MVDVSKHAVVQDIAKKTMNTLKGVIREGITEREIVAQAETIMRELGVTEFWYHGIGAFVHVGKRTIVSESGKDYQPSDIVVGRNDLVTIDLSPELNGYWGDYARTYIISNGRAISDDELENEYEDVINESGKDCMAEFIHGIKTEKQLHRMFMEYVTPDKTFEDVFLYLNTIINQCNYINLEFAGNLGHTIEFNKETRRYFEKGNKTKLSEVGFITFEPHIRCKNGKYGYKREDIYYFNRDKLCVL